MSESNDGLKIKNDDGLRLVGDESNNDELFYYLGKRGSGSTRSLVNVNVIIFGDAPTNINIMQ